MKNAQRASTKQQPKEDFNYNKYLAIIKSWIERDSYLICGYRTPAFLSCQSNSRSASQWSERYLNRLILFWWLAREPIDRLVRLPGKNWKVAWHGVSIH